MSLQVILAFTFRSSSGFEWFFIEAFALMNVHKNCLRQIKSPLGNQLSLRRLTLDWIICHRKRLTKQFVLRLGLEQLLLSQVAPVWFVGTNQAPNARGGSVGRGTENVTMVTPHHPALSQCRHGINRRW